MTSIVNEQLKNKFKIFLSIFWVWFPPAISTLFLTLELPIITTIIGAFGGSEDIAAFGLVLSCLILVTAPVFAIAGTVTLWAKSSMTLRQMRLLAIGAGAAFSLILMVALGTSLIAVILQDLWGLSEAISDKAQQGLWAVASIPLAISLRRYYQAQFILLKRTACVGAATWSRFLFSTLAAMFVLSFFTLPVVFSACISLAIAAYLEVFLLKILLRKRKLNFLTKDVEVPPMRRAISLFLPLAGTTLLGLAYQPVVTSFLASFNNSAVALAAWPFIFQLLYIFICLPMELDSVTVSVSRIKEGQKMMKWFSLSLGLFSSVVLLILAYTSLGNFYLQQVKELNAEVSTLVLHGLRSSFLLPLFFTLRMWLRGKLLLKSSSGAVQYATLAGLLVLILAFLTGKNWYSLSGIDIASIALYASLLTEMGVLALFLRKRSLQPVLYYRQV